MTFFFIKTQNGSFKQMYLHISPVKCGSLCSGHSILSHGTKLVAILQTKSVFMCVNENFPIHYISNVVQIMVWQQIGDEL